MNCQDVSRLIDGGSFGAISARDRQDAESHARQCRRCAVPWNAHARVAAMAVPPMPPDLSRHCLAMVARAGRVPASPRAPRMFIVVSGLVALAAAASILGVSLSGKLAPQRGGPIVSIIAPQAPGVPGARGNTADAAGEPAPVATQGRAAADAAQDLPLFPPPPASSQAASARLKRALDKFLDLHPELAQVPPAGTLYDGTIVMRDDGKVLDHSLRTMTPEEQTRHDPYGEVPNDSRNSVGANLPRGYRLPNGRTLGADLTLRSAVVQNTYDLSRSSLRVQQIIRSQRPETLRPATRTGAGQLTVLLSADGVIRREVAGYLDQAAMEIRDTWSTTRRAEAMAGSLGVSRDEIGLMGTVDVVDSGTNRGVVVDYAWQRLPGESAPQYRQGWDRHAQEGVDTSAALKLVERVMPDAFMGGATAYAFGVPAILLSEKGEFLRAERVRSTDPQKSFPGVAIAMMRPLELKNDRGATVSVYFMWQQASPAMAP